MPPYLSKETGGREFKHLYAISPTPSKSHVYFRYHDADNIRQTTFVKASEEDSLGTEKNSSTNRFSYRQKVKTLTTVEEDGAGKKSAGSW